MADQTQRLEIATVRAEIGGNIVYHFTNDPAANSPIPTESGDIPNLKQVIAQIQEDGAEKISVATTIFQSPAAGLAATANGGIFLVQSADADTIYTVWQNQAGAAVNTGKTAMSSQAVQDALTESNEAAQAAEDAADVATARTAGFIQPSATAPVVRDNGLPLQIGDRYFNTTEQAEYLYKSDGWSANDSIAAIDDLKDNDDSAKGAALVGFDGGLASDVLADARSVANYAAMRLYTGIASSLNLYDGFRSGRFRKISTTSAGYTDDGGITIIGVNGWVWQRTNVGIVQAEWFLDSGWSAGVTDDTSAFQRAIAYRRTNGGGKVQYFLQHLIDQDLYVNDYVHLEGTLSNAEELLDGVQAYSSKASTLILNPTKTIYLESGAKHSCGLVIPKGMTLRFPTEAAATAGLAAFAGTAFTARGAGAALHDSTVWGFDLGFSSNNLERASVKDNKFDCNNGVRISACYDIADVCGNHFWPWLTTHRGFADTLLARPGTCIQFSNVGDWNRAISNFGYGYNRGLVVDSSDNIESINCGFDHISSLNNTTSYAFEVKGTSKNTTLIAPQSAAQFGGLLVNTTATSGAEVTVTSGQFWANDGAHITVLSGYVKCMNSSFRAGPVGVNINAASAGGTFIGNVFDGVTTPFTGLMDKSTADMNTYVNCVDSVMGVRRVGSGQLTNKLDWVYGTTGVNNLTRRAAGTQAAPTALADAQVIQLTTAGAYNGSAYNSIAAMRAQTRAPQTASSAAGGWVFATCPVGSTGLVDRWIMDSDGSLRPIGDATQNFGSASGRINNSYLAVAATVGSDSRYKTNPETVPDAVLDAWAKVEFVQYKLLDAVDEKGEAARTHFGLIAQQVVEAFASEGLDACEYGVLCHDKWEAQEAQPAVLDDEGAVLIPAVQAVAADDRYSIRYSEAEILTAALHARTARRVEERLAALEGK